MEEKERGLITEEFYVSKHDGHRRRLYIYSCLFCGTEFKNRNRYRVVKYCSRKCSHSASDKSIELSCAYCGNKILRSPSKMKVSKSGLFFCDKKCKTQAQRIGGIKEIQPHHYGDLDSDKNKFLRDRTKFINENNIQLYGFCEICGIECNRVVDHCHTTGNIRGLLCNQCNIGLGAFKDKISSLDSAILYLMKGLY